MTAATTNKKKPSVKNSAVSPGVNAGSAGSAAIVAENRVMTASQGHGYAAELANHRADLAAGKRAILAPEGLAKNGADRIVNGVRIQTKYCKDAASTVRACFGKDGKFLYIYKPTGKPMQIEVPPEQRKEAIELLAAEIRAQRVDGVTDPKHAARIIRAGSVSRQAAMDIAKAGTINGLKYDAERGVELAGHAAGLSAGLAFAQAVWNGSSVEEAVEAACYTGLRVGGVSWASSVVSAQLGRSALNQGMISSSQWAAQQLKQYGGGLFKGESANQLSKALHGNGLAVVATTLVTSSADLVRLFDSRISVGQLFKNVTTTAVGTAAGIQGMGPGAFYGRTAGGVVGMYLGGPPGKVIGKLIGTVIGGLVGSAGASTVAQGATRWVMDGLIEDDAAEMLAITNSVFVELGQQHMLGKIEAQALTASVADALSASVLRDMYASSDRSAFAKSIIEPLIAPIISSRKVVVLPSEAEFASGLYRLAERACNDADEDQRILTNKDGSLQCDMPQGFVVNEKMAKSRALPAICHETDKVLIASFDYPAAGTRLAADYINSHRTQRTEKPEFVRISDVAAVATGDRECYGYWTETSSTGYRYNAFRATRLFDKLILLGLMTNEENLLLRHEEALDRMIGSLALNRIDPIEDESWPVFRSHKGDYKIQTPPGWRVMENPPLHPEGTDVLLVLESDFCGMWIAVRFEKTDGLTLEDTARNMACSASDTDPDAVVSVESVIVAGREITLAQACFTSDGKPEWTMFALQHEDNDHMIAVCAVMNGSTTVGYREQCQDMVWRFTKVATRNESSAFNVAADWLHTRASR